MLFAFAIVISLFALNDTIHATLKKLIVYIDTENCMHLTVLKIVKEQKISYLSLKMAKCG